MHQTRDATLTLGKPSRYRCGKSPVTLLLAGSRGAAAPPQPAGELINPYPWSAPLEDVRLKPE